MTRSIIDKKPDKFEMPGAAVTIAGYLNLGQQFFVILLKTFWLKVNQNDLIYY